MGVPDSVVFAQGVVAHCALEAETPFWTSRVTILQFMHVMLELSNTVVALDKG